MLISEKSKISVIIAVFNRSSVIQRAIESFVQQDYLDKELIVIDGGSDDGTVEIIKNLDSHIAYWTSEKDRGIYHAFNKGVENSTGNWLYFLGSDDYFHDPRSLSKVSAYLDRVDIKKHKVVYGKVSLVSPTGTTLEEINQPWKQIKNSFLQGCYLCHQGVFQHKSLFEEYGKFDETFKISGVYDFLLRELKNSDALFMPNISVASMEVGSGLSSSPGNALRIMREYSRARRNNEVYDFAYKLYVGYIKAYTRFVAYQILGRDITLLIIDLVRKITGRNMIWQTIRAEEK